MDTEDIIEIKPEKKRGRPRKNVNATNIILDKKKTSGNMNINRELILHLPISMNRNDNKNDIDNDNDSKNFIENISINNESSSDLSYDDLINELQMREKIIKRLKEEINLYKTSNINIGTKDVNYKKLNINLIDSKSFKPIIPENNNICCWWCCHTFDNYACFLPERYEDIYESEGKSIGTYYVMGCFCSDNCALSYNINLNDYKTNDRTSLIKRIHYEKTKSYNLTPAPPKEVLKKFGGPYSIDEYRRNFNTPTNIKMISSSFIQLPMLVEERQNERTFINKNDSNKYIVKTEKKNIFQHFS